jgi:hypothetical protein
LLSAYRKLRVVRRAVANELAEINDPRALDGRKHGIIEGRAGGKVLTLDGDVI